MEFEQSLIEGPHALLAGLVGRYEGRARLWMRPDQLEDDEPVTGEIVALHGGRFVQHSYSTRIGGDPVSGQALVGCKLDDMQWQVAWIDTWHTGLEIMQSTGGSTPQATEVDVATTYAGGDWGWRSTFAPTDDGAVVRHYNSGPGLDEYLSAELTYTRL